MRSSSSSSPPHKRARALSLAVIIRGESWCCCCSLMLRRSSPRWEVGERLLKLPLLLLPSASDRDLMRTLISQIIPPFQTPRLPHCCFLKVRGENETPLREFCSRCLVTSKTLLLPAVVFSHMEKKMSILIHPMHVNILAIYCSNWANWASK